MDLLDLLSRAAVAPIPDGACRLRDAADVLYSPRQVDYLSQIESTSLGNPGLDKYYADIFGRMIAPLGGTYLLHVILNFALQQLATRSRASRDTEGYLQIGSFTESDFAAALVNSMPQTETVWLPGCGQIGTSMTRDGVDTVKAKLPADGMSEHCFVLDQNWPAFFSSPPRVKFGFIAIIIQDQPESIPDLLHAVLPHTHTQSRILLVQTPLIGKLVVPAPLSGRLICNFPGVPNGGFQVIVLEACSR